MLTVNGDQIEYIPDMTVQDVLDAKKYTFPLVIITVNDEFVPSEDYATFKVPDEADVKVIHLMAGG